VSGLEPAPTRFVSAPAGDELVRTLAQLTRDVERIDSMIRNQRHLLQQHGADIAESDDRLIRRQSRRIIAGVAEMVTRARDALEELSGLPEINEIVSLELVERKGVGRRAIGQPAERSASVRPYSKSESSAKQRS
jgi:hypothetical protein